jgi:lysophospholipase L1-like esterase
LPIDRKFTECQTVKVYLQNTINFATSQHFPIADAFHASLKGTDGDPLYINQGDHIHPSDAGKTLFADLVTEAIGEALNTK